MDRRGYTLIELIITIAILLIVVWPLLSMVAEGSRNNQRTRFVEEATQLAQRIMEERIHSPQLTLVTDEDVVFTSGPYRGYTVRINVTQALQPSIDNMRSIVGQTAAPAPNTIPRINFISNTGRRQLVSVPDLQIISKDTALIAPSAGNGVWPIPADIEDYVHTTGRINVNGIGSTEAVGLDVLIRLTNSDIEARWADNPEISRKITTNLICIATEEGQSSSTGKLILRFGNDPLSPIGEIPITDISTGAHIGFIVDANASSRLLQLLNRPHFPVSVKVIRGKSTNTEEEDWILANLQNALNMEFDLNRADGYTEADINAGFTSMEFLSPLFSIDRGYYMQSDDAWTTGQDAEATLYDVEIKVFRTVGGSVDTPLVELRTAATPSHR